MDIPHFIQHPPTKTELETLEHWIKGLSARQIADIRCLAKTTIEGHLQSLRFKFHSTKCSGVLCRMIALGIVRRAQLMKELPQSWLKYVRR